MMVAGQIFAIEKGLSAEGFYQLSDLVPYIPLKFYPPANGMILPWCPEGGWYAPGADITNPPFCSVSAHGHYLTNP